jgi:competence protein ComEC
MGTMLFPVLVALVAGLAAGALIDGSLDGHAWTMLLLAWGAATIAYRQGWPRVCLSAATAAALAAGWLLGADQARRALAPPLRVLLDDRYGGFAIGTPPRRLPEPVVIEGRLTTDAARSAAGVQLRLAVDRVWLDTCPEPAAGGVALTVAGIEAPGLAGEWTAGRLIRVAATLRRPAVYRNDGLPDQEVRLARRGVALVGSVKSGLLVDVRARGHWLEEGAARVRAYSRRALGRLDRDDESSRAGAVATAILIGDRAGLDPDTDRRLQEAGTYHVIAISGGNIAILAGLVLGLLALLGLRGPVATAVTITGLIAYAWLAGGGPSVTRATMMAVVYLAVRLIDQRTAALNAIALTALLLLLAAPLAIFDVGLWLSFGATTAIVLGAAWVPLPRRRWLAAPAALLLASVCSELVLMPISAAVFERVTLAGLLLNFVAIPCMTVVQIGAMAVVALDPVWSHGAGVAARLTAWAAAGLLDSARLVEWWPWLAWRVPAPTARALTGYYASLALLIWVCRPAAPSHSIRRLAASGVVAALALWIALAPHTWPAPSDGLLRVTMFDVGQGDAVLVTFPGGKRLLMDTGGLPVTGSFDLGDRVLGPALRARGVRRLDYLAISHPHADHAGGASRIVRDFGTREIWEGVPVPPDEIRAAIVEAARQARAVWRVVQRGDEITIDDVRVRALHPPLPDWERQRTRNDDSLVVELRYGDVAVVLTGDIGQEIEHEVAPLVAPAPVVVLKVPHHGSATSSSERLLDRLNPAVALIGVGRANLFGHPAPAVLRRYQARGIRVYRTDLHGQIDLVTDGTSVDVTTYVERRTAPRTPVNVDGGSGTVTTESSVLLGLRLLPERLQLVQRHLLQGALAAAGCGLHPLEATLELVVGPAQRRLGLVSQETRQVGQGEEDVAELVLGFPRAWAMRGHRGAQFGHLFVDLVQHLVGRRPVEADRGGARAELVGAQQGGEHARHPGEHRTHLAAGGLSLAGLQILPLAHDLVGCHPIADLGKRVAVGREDVRMAAHELVGDAVHGVGDGEVAGLLCDLREENGLVQEVAQLFTERSHVAVIERLEQLVGLLEHERAERRQRLPAIPGAPFRRAQRTHDLDESREGFSGCGHVRVRAPPEDRALWPRRVGTWPRAMLPSRGSPVPPCQSLPRHPPSASSRSSTRWPATPPCTSAMHRSQAPWSRGRQTSTRHAT